MLKFTPAKQVRNETFAKLRSVKFSIEAVLDEQDNLMKTDGSRVDVEIDKMVEQLFAARTSLIEWR